MCANISIMENFLRDVHVKGDSFSYIETYSLFQNVFAHLPSQISTIPVIILIVQSKVLKLIKQKNNFGQVFSPNLSGTTLE